MKDSNPVAILSSDAMRSLAMDLTARLQERNPRYGHIPVDCITFANGEVRPSIKETVRSKDVYLLHSLFHPDPNTALMQLFLTENAISLASPASLTLILPYIPYLRQDRKDGSRAPISARMIADLITRSGGRKLARIITMDMHVEQEEGFFDIPVDNVPGRILHAQFFRRTFDGDVGNVIIVSPDVGGALRAKRLAIMLGVPLGILEKQRGEGARVTTHSYTGEDLAGKDVILLDDMIDTGNTTIAAIRAIQDRKAQQVFVCATHAIFSASGGSSAEDKLALEGARIVVTDSIPRSDEYYAQHKPWLTVLRTNDLFTEVLYESDREGGSVSACLKR